MASAISSPEQSLAGIWVGRRWRWLSAIVVAAGLILGGRAWWIDHHYRAAMAEIEAEIVAGRYAIACRNLNALLTWKADRNGGIVYLLGSCELARGRNQAAAAAWERVVPGSEFSERAIRGRMRLLHQSGQLAAAERLILQAAEDRRNDRTALLVALVPIYEQQGRIEEAERLIEDRWEHENAAGEGALEPAIKLLRQHIDLTVNPASIEAIRNVLDQAARLAPDDDRVWLGRANLAIRTGVYDEAERWLDACLKHRPEDIPAWRARLSWGLATKRPDVVEKARSHIPAEESTPAQVHRQEARLEDWWRAEPADLDRLTRIAEKGGQSGQLDDLRNKRAEIDKLRARYRKLHERKQPIRDAVELARIAERLGRIFEARVFLSLAISEDPDRDDLRHDLRQLGTHPVRPR